MTNRLQLIYSLISPGKGVIDVGTDHGYIPAELAKNHYPGKIIASDIHAFPLDAAKKTADRSGVSGRIEFLVSDGLTDCDPDCIDTILIAGMGGDLICRILDQAEWCMNEKYRLILQPMTKKEILRYWLINNGFGEIKDYLAEESGKIYHIIVPKFTGKNVFYSDAQLYTGKKSSVNETLFEKMRENEFNRMQKICSGLRSGGADIYIQNFYSTILNEMQGAEN